MFGGGGGGGWNFTVCPGFSPMGWWLNFYGVSCNGWTSKVCTACPVMTKTSQSHRSLAPTPLAAAPVPPYPGVEPAFSALPAPLRSSLMQTPCDGPCQKGTASWWEKQWPPTFPVVWRREPGPSWRRLLLHWQQSPPWLQSRTLSSDNAARLCYWMTRSDSESLQVSNTPLV